VREIAPPSAAYVLDDTIYPINMNRLSAKGTDEVMKRWCLSFY